MNSDAEDKIEQDLVVSRMSTDEDLMHGINRKILALLENPNVPESFKVKLKVIYEQNFS